MGLSIHYRGKFKTAKAFPEFIREVKEVVEISGWPYHIFEEAPFEEDFQKVVADDRLYGIYFTPEQCESISLAFLSNGRLVCPIRLSFADSDELNREKSDIYTISVKTQFAGVRIHQIIIRFFRYLSEKYFVDFEMIDESDYWETNNEEKMRDQFKKYDDILDNFELATQTFPLEKDETVENYIERLIEHINRLYS